MFFTKSEYKEIELPFLFISDPEEIDAGIISIEAYGNILGENQYCYASYEVNMKFFDELSALLSDTFDKTIKVVFKIKKGKAKKFKINLDSLAEAYNDERFKKLGLLSWCLSDVSFKYLK